MELGLDIDWFAPSFFSEPPPISHDGGGIDDEPLRRRGLSLSSSSIGGGHLASEYLRCSNSGDDLFALSGGDEDDDLSSAIDLAGW